MDLSLRTITDDERAAYYAAIQLGFGGAPHEDDRALHAPLIELDRTLAAYDGNAIVGTAGAFSFSMTVPGAQLPVAGVTGVSVVPTHRRRGVLTRMMTSQLADIRTRGREAVAALFASEGTIYPRFGYGLASVAGHVKLDTSRVAFRDQHPRAGRIELVDPTDAPDVIRTAYDDARRRRPGMVERTDAWWTKRLADPEHSRGDFSPLRVSVHRDGDRCEGYAVYRTRSAWTDGMPDGTVDVREVVATTPEATESLWRYLVGLDLMRTVVAPWVPLDTPLLHLVTEPRALQLRVSDNLWVRLVDVPTALAQRRYATGDRVVLDVVDDVCPWNTGRFALTGSPEDAQCEATDAAADLRLTAVELGAVYLGGTRLGSLAAAGRVEELTPGAVRRADTMFSWSPLPVCPEVF